MIDLENLNAQEKKLLLNAPAYISLLASNADGEMDDMEKRSAIEFSHIKTYSCHPSLRIFYKEVEHNFKTTIEQLDHELSEEKAEREKTIQNKLSELEYIIPKLGEHYAELMYKSLKSYAKHVSKAHHNVLTSFFIPFYIKGLTY